MMRLGTAIVAVTVLSASAYAQQPPDQRGRLLFLQCAACHTLAAGGAHKVGPNLHGIFGQPASSQPGFAYSPALGASRIVWTPATMKPWLKNLSALVSGSRMAFGGVKTDADIDALIGYLQAVKQ